MPQSINPNGIDAKNVTYYTVLKEDEVPVPYSTLILTPSNRTGKPSKMCCFDSQEEAEYQTKAHYGQNIVYVGVHHFHALVQLKKGT